MLLHMAKALILLWGACGYRNCDLPMNSRRSSAVSPEKEDRYYTTRGSLGLDENGKVLVDNLKEDKGFVWPKLFTTLSSKEKEEDFMAMKGCKPPQRPKKRAKLIQKSLLVSLLNVLSATIPLLLGLSVC